MLNIKDMPRKVRFSSSNDELPKRPPALNVITLCVNRGKIEALPKDNPPLPNKGVSLFSKEVTCLN